jgi:hypothetical protein
MPRTLRYVVVEAGNCRNCGKDAGGHSIEGICGPSSRAGHGSQVAERVYQGQPRYAFINMDSPEVRTWLKHFGVLV